MARFKHLSYRALQFAWVAVAFYLLWKMLQISVLPETALPAAYKAEKLMFLGLVMMVMSFPAGLLWWIFLVGVYEFIHPGLSENPQTTVFIEWAGAFVLGYLQWFWLIPLYNKKAIKDQSKA